MSCVSPLLAVALSVPLVITQSFCRRIHPETSSSTTMTPSLDSLTAFSSPSLSSGLLCTHLSFCLSLALQCWLFNKLSSNYFFFPLRVLWMCAVLIRGIVEGRFSFCLFWCVCDELFHRAKTQPDPPSHDNTAAAPWQPICHFNTKSSVLSVNSMIISLTQHAAILGNSFHGTACVRLIHWFSLEDHLCRFRCRRSSIRQCGTRIF